MYYLFLLALAVLPVMLILFFTYEKDKNSEPKLLLIGLFFSGFLSCIITLIISWIMELFLPFMGGTLETKTFTEILLYAFFGVALVEEFSKWIMTYLVGYRHKEFDELYDGLVYAVFVSLGFAFVENILYVFLSSSIQTAFLRALSAVPSHACDAVFMGYYLSVAKQCEIKGKNKQEKKNLIKSILVPMLVHGIYDYCLMSGIELMIYVFFIFVVIMYIVSITKLNSLSKNNKKIIFKNKFCSKCGSPVVGEFCPNCGTRQE